MENLWQCTVTRPTLRASEWERTREFLQYLVSWTSNKSLNIVGYFVYYSPKPHICDTVYVCSWKEVGRDVFYCSVCAYPPQVMTNAVKKSAEGLSYSQRRKRSMNIMRLLL